MAGRDLGIWARWRQNFPFPYKGFYFDVALGTPPPADPSVMPQVNRAWEFLLAKRIDAVGVLGASYHIIEIRRGADQPAIGTLEGYGFLWKKDPPDPNPIELILVTDAIEPDTEDFATSKGIQVYKVT